MTAATHIQRLTPTPFSLRGFFAQAAQSLRATGEVFVRIAYDKPWLRDAAEPADTIARLRR